PRRAIVDDLGLRVQTTRKQDVDVGKLGGIEQPIPHAADVHSTLSGVGIGLRVPTLTTARRVQLNRRYPSGCSDNGVFIRPLAEELTEIDARLVLLNRTGRRDV